MDCRWADPGGKPSKGSRTARSAFLAEAPSRTRSCHDDEAAAVALGVSAETVAGWRAMLATEPTVTNRRVGKTGDVDIVRPYDYAC